MKIATHTRRNALLLLLAAMSLRAIVPIGYMPGSLESGLLFELCPDGMPAAMMQALGGHHHHGGGDSEAMSLSFEKCAMGHLFASAAISSTDVVAPELPEPPAYLPIPPLLLIAAAPAPYSSRAPPVIA